jgi:hypothetical protein
MSRGFYYKMKRLGIGPRETWVLGRVQITAEDEAAWVEQHAAPKTTEERLRREAEAEARRARAFRAVEASMRAPSHRMNVKAARDAAVTKPRKAAARRARSTPP